VRTAQTIDGIWRWTFTMPDGTTARPKLILETDNGKLWGTSSFRPGSETPVTNIVFNGNLLRFQVIREREGRQIVTTYTGQWSGKTLQGKVESDWAGDKQVYDWEAQRAHEGAEGTWRWPVTIRGRKLEMRVDMEQDGQFLTGHIPGFGRRRKIEIKNGSIKDGEVYFEVERGTGAEKVVTSYKGQQTGDIIKGTIETTIDGKEQKTPWQARRSE
ncbi:MAG: hypothetical protein L0Z50_06965, partial [Verrucomicrobiales bacterium]|nr:hypothetical protein [Verrucomicrobiales bacterium]